MAGGVAGFGGGILGLLCVVEEHGDALEYDLIRAGLRLRDCPSEAFTWRDLLVFVRHSDDRSALWQAQHPKFKGWPIEARLLAIIANALRWLVWAKTRDGAKNRNKPVPIGPDMNDKVSRPGLKVKPAPLSRVKQLLGLGEGGSQSRRLGRVFGR